MLSIIKNAFRYLSDTVSQLNDEEVDSLSLVAICCMFICFMTVALILVVMFAYTIA